MGTTLERWVNKSRIRSNLTKSTQTLLKTSPSRTQFIEMPKPSLFNRQPTELYPITNVKRKGKPMLKLTLTCVLSMMLLSCGSTPPKLQDPGTVVETPQAPPPVPPATQLPLKYKFQTRLQESFDPLPSTPTP